MARFKNFCEEEFWSKAEKTDSGCWNWLMSKNGKGYGKITYKRQSWLAHRLSYYLKHGEIKNFILHSCDNPSCINPDHLRDGTQKENVMDMFNRGRKIINKRDYCKSGIHKLSVENTSYDHKGFRICRLCRNQRCYESRDRRMMFNAFL